MSKSRCTVHAIFTGLNLDLIRLDKQTRGEKKSLLFLAQPKSFANKLQNADKKQS